MSQVYGFRFAPPVAIRCPVRGRKNATFFWSSFAIGFPREGIPEKTGARRDSRTSKPPVPADLKHLDLRLRAIDKRDSNGMRAIVFVGPIRLVELPGTGR